MPDGLWLNGGNSSSACDLEWLSLNPTPPVSTLLPPDNGGATGVVWVLAGVTVVMTVVADMFVRGVLECIGVGWGVSGAAIAN